MKVRNVGWESDSYLNHRHSDLSSDITSLSPLLLGWSIMLANEVEFQITWQEKILLLISWRGPRIVISSQGCPFVIKYQCLPGCSVRTNILEDSIMSLIYTLWVDGWGKHKDKKDVYLLRLFTSFVFHRGESGLINSFSSSFCFFFCFFFCCCCFSLFFCHYKQHQPNHC